MEVYKPDFNLAFAKVPEFYILFSLTIKVYINKV
jgi:hypothetical protein